MSITDDEREIEDEIREKGLNAPRLSPGHIESLAERSECEYHVFHGVQTVCSMRLPNGFTVLGTSACASPENFDRALGEKIARQEARGKLWELEGYLLRSELAKNLPIDRKDS